jgi:hypothetical protein
VAIEDETSEAGDRLLVAGDGGGAGELECIGPGELGGITDLGVE